MNTEEQLMLARDAVYLQHKHNPSNYFRLLDGGDRNRLARDIAEETREIFAVSKRYGRLVVHARAILKQPKG